MEQALRHVLSEVASLLKRPDSTELMEVISLLNELAIKTSNSLAEGFNRIRSTEQLTREARKIEETVDVLSQVLWSFESW